MREIWREGRKGGGGVEGGRDEGRQGVREGRHNCMRWQWWSGCIWHDVGAKYGTRAKSDNQLVATNQMYLHDMATTCQFTVTE